MLDLQDKIRAVDAAIVHFRQFRDSGEPEERVYDDLRQVAPDLRQTAAGDVAMIDYRPAREKAESVALDVRRARMANDAELMRRVLCAAHGTAAVEATEAYFRAQLAADRLGAGDYFELGPALHLLAWLAAEGGVLLDDRAVRQREPVWPERHGKGKSNASDVDTAQSAGGGRPAADVL